MESDKFEYLVEYFAAYNRTHGRTYIAERLNEVGMDGWEMCGIQGDLLYFKRKKGQ